METGGGASVSQQPTAEEEARTNVAAGKEEYAVEISPCTRFYDEWRQCTSGYSRFHQYYIYGQFRSCAEQKERLRNCIKWRVSGSEHAREQLVGSLRREQESMHTPNPVWKMRTTPPVDWTRKS